MDKEEILLKEYEVCQSHNNSLGNQSWISFSILITVNLLLLGQVISSLVLTSSPNTGYSKLIFVILLSLAMIYILYLFKLWDRRVTFHTRLNHVRMRDIEKEIAARKGYWLLQKKWSERSLDIEYGGEKEEIPETFKTILEKLKKQFSPKGEKDEKEFQTEYVLSVTKGFWRRFDRIFCVLITLWSATIVLEIFIYISYCFWPSAYNWLLN